MKPSDAELLVDAATPKVRKLLVRARAGAMRGRLETAVADLDCGVSAAASPLDAVALSQLKAELYHLNREDTVALTVLREDVLPKKLLLPQSVQFVVEGNLATLEMSVASTGGVSAFYHLVDARRKADYEWFDYHNLAEAWDALDRERLPDAVRPLWRDLARSYRQGYWQASRWAERRFAKLCLTLGELEKAAYYATLGTADEQIPSLAEALAARRDMALVRTVVRKTLETANLRRHFVSAAKLLAAISDVIPDDQVEDVVRWLLRRCRESDELWIGDRVVPAAWNALESLGGRTPPLLASEGVRIAVTHPLWATPHSQGQAIVDRGAIVEAVTHLCHQVPVETLGGLATEALPLAHERAQNLDYPKVVNLLANIAERAGGDTMRLIADALYPPGQQPNRVLGQLDRFFGKEALSVDALALLASTVAGEIRLQVQRVEPGEQPVRLPETLAVWGRTDGTGPIVTIGQGLGLAVLERHRERLEPHVLEGVVSAIIEAIRDPDNVPRNRQSLLAQLIDFADRVTEPMRGDVFTGALSVTEMSGSGLPPRPSAQSVQTAFNGDPDDVRMTALVCAAAYAVGDAERVRRLGEVIEDMSAHPNPKLRRGAFAAARRLPDLPADAFPPLLMGLRDPDPGTAIAAFAAFTERTEWRLTRPQWKLFLLAVRTTADLPHTNLRRHAAAAVSRLSGSVPSGLRRQASELMERFCSDPSAAVRFEVQRAELPRAV